MGWLCEILKVEINLLTFIESKKNAINNNRMRYSIFLIIVTLFFLIKIRSVFVSNLDEIIKKNNSVNAKFYENVINENKKNKTLWLLSFLLNIPYSIQDNLYIKKLVMRENLITLSVYANEQDMLEKFVYKIRKQVGIKNITIDSSAIHGDIDHENEENKFILTLYLDDTEKFRP